MGKHAVLSCTLQPSLSSLHSHAGGMPQDRFVVTAYLIRHHERLSPPDRDTASIGIQPSLNDISFEFPRSAFERGIN